jgi:DNA replication protein DnaC
LLTHPTLDQLHALGLYGMAKAFSEIMASGEETPLSHPEWLALLLERETSWRHDKRFTARLRYAKLRQQACMEDVDYRTPRNLDRSLFQKLAGGQWIEDHDNLVVTGPTGVGKSWLAQALGHTACRGNRSVLYQRVPRLFAELALARGDGRHPRLLRSLGRVDLLILDDWGLEPLEAAARHDLLEILEERYGRRSTVVTSQLPVDKWHEIIGDPTYADAILDRLVHNAHRIDLSGESLRNATKYCPPEWPAPREKSNRNGGRNHFGIDGRIRRNPHPELDVQRSARPIGGRPGGVRISGAGLDWKRRSRRRTGARPVRPERRIRRRLRHRVPNGRDVRHPKDRVLMTARDLDETPEKPPGPDYGMIVRGRYRREQ